MSRAPSAREAWSAEVRAAQLALVEDAVVSWDQHRSHVAAFDAATGAPRWRYPFSTRILGVHGRHLLAWAGHDEIHLLDVASGRPEGCFPHHPADAAIVAGDVLFASRKPSWSDEALVTAVDLTSSRRLWMHVGEPERAGRSNAGALAVGEGAVVTGYNGAVVSLHARTGAVRWRRDWPEWEERQPEQMAPPKVERVFIVGGRVIAGVLSAMRRIVCLSLDDGRTLWDAEGPLDVVDDRFAYGAEFNRYHVRQLGDGELRRREAASGGPATMPRLLHASSRLGAVAGGHAYLIAGQMQGEALIAVEREKGRYAWHHQPPGGSQASVPLFADGRLFYLSGGRLFCLEPPEPAKSSR
jgi:outer membrane protein assembly factor BamB